MGGYTVATTRSTGGVSNGALRANAERTPVTGTVPPLCNHDSFLASTHSLLSHRWVGSTDRSPFRGSMAAGSPGPGLAFPVPVPPPAPPPPAVPSISPPGMALAEELDHLMFFQLRDGRKFYGVLRSFDQYANLVFDGCVERSVVEDKYADEDLGMQVIRGENLVLMGGVGEEGDPVPDMPASFSRVGKEEMQRLQEEQKEAQRAAQQALPVKFDFLDE